MRNDVSLGVTERSFLTDFADNFLVIPMQSRTRLTPEQLRSHRYLGPDDLRSFGHRSRQKQAGFSTEDFSGKPVIGILNTWNDLISCHAHFRQRVEEIKRGVWQAGGFPVEIPVMGLSETFMKPTSMYYRNFLAMEAEEVLRTYLETPLLDTVHAVLFEGLAPRDGLLHLLARDPKREHEPAP